MDTPQSIEQEAYAFLAARLKCCTGCGVWKAKSGYHRSRHAKDGLASSCKVCKNWASYLQRLRTPERLRAQKKAWSIAHAAEIKKRRAEQRRLNREAINAAKREKYANTYAKEPQKYLSSVHKRRALVEDGGSYSQEEWDALCARYGNKCLWCDAKTALTVDHVVPLSQGGSNTIDNLQPLCARCNRAKYSRVMDFRVFHE